MYNESRKWLIRLVLTLLIILLVSLTICLATRRTETSIPIPQATIETIPTLPEDFDEYIPCYVKMEGGYPSIITEEYLIRCIEAEENRFKVEDIVLWLKYEEGKWGVEEEKEELSIDEPLHIIMEFATTGEWYNEFRPQLFLKITNTDLSRCLFDNRLRIDLNGQIYWIRLEKD